MDGTENTTALTPEMNRTGDPLALARPLGPPDYVFAIAYEAFIMTGILVFILFSLPQTIRFLRSDRIKEGWRFTQSEDNTLSGDAIIKITKFESRMGENGIRTKPPQVHTITFPAPVSESARNLRTVSKSYFDFDKPSTKESASLTPVPRGQSVAGAWTGWIAAKMSKFIGGPVSMQLGPWLVVLSVNIVANALFSLGPPFFVLPDRPAHIAIAQIPILFVLATKNNFLSYLLGKSYEKLNFIHRTMGRLVALCATLHVVGQFIKYSRRGALGELMRIPWVQAGLVAWIGLVIVTLGSIGPVRIKLYDVFLNTHVVGILIFMVALHFHMPAVVTPYTLAGLSFYLIDLILRACKMRLRPARITALDDEMTLICVQGISSGWRAGQHIWLRILQGNRSYESHPFTIANAPTSASSGRSEGLHLYARVGGNFTRALNADARLRPNSSIEADVIVDGPYGGMMTMDLADNKNVMLIAGGAGASFVVSLLEDLVLRSIQRKACTEDYAHLKWHMHTIERNIQGAGTSSTSLRVRLYVTDSQTAPKVPQPSASSLEVIFKRPDIPALVAEAVNYAALAGQSSIAGGGGLALATCGPVPMVRDVQLATRRVSVKDRRLAGGVSLHTEGFGL